MCGHVHLHVHVYKINDVIPVNYAINAHMYIVLQRKINVVDPACAIVLGQDCLLGWDP